MGFSLTPSALLVAGCLAVGAVGIAGCTANSTNVAAQVSSTATIAPYKDDTGETLQKVRYKYKNNGPAAIALINARSEAFDAKGEKLETDSSDNHCVFWADSPDKRLKAGQEYEPPFTDEDVLLSKRTEGRPVARIVVTVMSAKLENDDTAGR